MRTQAGSNLTIGSLFSGIGGLELGLEMAGLGHTIWQVEQDAYCRAVLAKHWPNALRYDDVSTVGSTVLPVVDLICGGFPCQDVSSAGKRAGLSGARSGLWFEYLRIVDELRPQWVVVENVASGARAWVDVVREGLEQHGYACLPIPLAASDVGAPHERQRVFIVAAHANATLIRDESRRRRRQNREGSHVAPNDGPQGVTADANTQGQLAFSGHEEMARSPASADADASRRKRGVAGGFKPKVAARLHVRHWRKTQPDMVRVVSGIPRRLDSPRARIAALGNSVVPQCAQVIGHVIRELCAH